MQMGELRCEREQKSAWDKFLSYDAELPIRARGLSVNPKAGCLVGDLLGEPEMQTVTAFCM
jgi:hypothetical protein